MALTNWSPELIKFYNKQIIDRDSLYNKYRSEKYGKRWAKAFKNLSSVEKGNIKKLYLNWQKILPNIKKNDPGAFVLIMVAKVVIVMIIYCSLAYCVLHCVSFVSSLFILVQLPLRNIWI